MAAAGAVMGDDVVQHAAVHISGYLALVLALSGCSQATMVEQLRDFCAGDRSTGIAGTADVSPLGPRPVFARITSYLPPGTWSGVVSIDGTLEEQVEHRERGFVPDLMSMGLPVRAEDVQLVVCVDGGAVDTGPRETCRYHGTDLTFTIARSEYRVRVYEAATARQRGVIDLAEDPSPFECPSRIAESALEQYEVRPARLDAERIRDAVRDWAE